MGWGKRGGWRKGLGGEEGGREEGETVIRLEMIKMNFKKKMTQSFHNTSLPTKAFFSPSGLGGLGDSRILSRAPF